MFEKINISIVSEEFNDTIDNFMTEEWVSSNLENFGREIGAEEWGTPINVVAFDSEEKKTILGVVKCMVVGNTLRIHQLLVKTHFRRNYRIGSTLLQEVERLCNENKWHKIRLSTSEKHNNLDFYLKNGFEIEAELKNDAFNLTWYILGKFLL